MADLAHRKACKKVQFLDKDGKPVCNSNVQVELKKHDFLFGCGAFDFVAAVSIPDEEKRGHFIERTEKWAKLFNYGTLPFYWGGFEKEEGKPDTENLMKAAKLLKNFGATVKGHPLCWHTGCAQWLLKYDNKTILEKQLARIHRDVGDFKGIIDMWDVINEVVIMPIYDKYDNAITRLCKEHGRIGLCKKVFEAAKNCNPAGTFLINDFNLSTSYEILIDGLLQSGVPITAIGLQSHQHHGVWGTEKLEEILSRFEHFGLPIHFTENTIVAGPCVDPSIIDLQDAHYDDDAATPELEQMQADELSKMYRNLFENHPLVTAITNWDFADGAWLNAPSGLIRKDNSLKPSYNALYDLIHKEWHTSLTVKTDENGFAEVEGFKGTYSAKTGDGKELFDFELK